MSERTNGDRCKGAMLAVTFLVAFSLHVLNAAEPSQEPPFERGEDYIQNELHLARTGLRAMAIAAHPDDEDGGTLSYLRRTLGAETHIVFSTRGEGGQNEIGPQLGAELAVLRTQEIDAACKILGAKPWFLNEPDFGFSKSADATLEKWGHDDALRRLVRIIRIVRPQILFTNHDANGNDHGHHVATGKLAVEAFDAAADAEKFKDDMEKDGTKPWSVSKLYVRHFAPEGTTLRFDISEVNPLTGLSAGDIAAYALTKHASQGMQFTRKLGEKEMRYFTLVKTRVEKNAIEQSMANGLVPVFEDDLPSWSAFPDQWPFKHGIPDPNIMYLSHTGFYTRPDLSIADFQASRVHEENAWAAPRIKIVCTSDDAVVAPGDEVKIKCRIAIGDEKFYLGGWKVIGESAGWEISTGTINELLSPHSTYEFYATAVATADAFPTYPLADYIFSRPELRTPLKIQIDDREIMEPNKFVEKKTLTAPVPVELSAPLTISVTPNPVLLFDDPDHTDEDKLVGKFTLAITNNRRVAGPDPLNYYAGIKPVNDAPVDNPAAFSFHDKGETLSRQFKFMASNDKLNKADVDVPLNIWTDKVTFAGPVAHLRRVPLKLPAPLSVALVKTTGDDVWNALKNLESGVGLTLTQLSDDDLRTMDLNRFHTIILDIRATQYRPVIRSVKERLLQFMKDGGNVVCLYQKDFDWNVADKEHPVRGQGFFKGQGGGGEIAPFPLELSFNRVTHPDAEVRILKPDHPLLLLPCKITPQDFQGWVQERAVYMPQSWAKEYTALLSSNDPADKPAPLDGGLLVADVEQGSFIYTSYVWHRQLRAGVPGAYRFLANLISYPRVKKQVKQ